MLTTCCRIEFGLCTTSILNPSVSNLIANCTAISNFIEVFSRFLAVTRSKQRAPSLQLQRSWFIFVTSCRLLQQNACRPLCSNVTLQSTHTQTKVVKGTWCGYKNWSAANIRYRRSYYACRLIVFRPVFECIQIVPECFLIRIRAPVKKNQWQGRGPQGSPWHPWW